MFKNISQEGERELEKLSPVFSLLRSTDVKLYLLHKRFLEKLGEKFFSIEDIRVKKSFDFIFEKEDYKKMKTLFTEIEREYYKMVLTRRESDIYLASLYEILCRDFYVTIQVFDKEDKNRDI